MSNNIMQGDKYSIPFTIKDSTGAYVTPVSATDVEIVIAYMRKSYAKNELTYQNNKWYFPLTQQESFKISDGLIPVQVRVKFQSGDVVGKSLGDLSLYDSISKEIL